MEWTTEKVANLTALHSEKLSPRQISIELGEGVTRNMVLGKLFRLGLSNPLTSTAWTDDELAIYEKMTAEGAKTKEIAAALPNRNVKGVNYKRRNLLKKAELANHV